MSLEGQSAEAQRRPPFGEMLGLSFRGLFQGVVRMPVLFAAVAAGLAAISVGASEFGPVHWATSVGATGTLLRSAILIAWSFALSIARLLVLVPLSMATYRFVLRGETNAWSAIARNLTAFFAWSVSLDVLTTAMDTLRVLMPARFLAVATFLGVVALLLIAMLGVRLWLIFPAAALGKRAHFLDRAGISWRQTEGHFWYLFWLDIVVSVAVALPFSLFASAMTWSIVSRAVAQPHTAVTLTYTVIVAAVASLGAVLRTGANASIGGAFYRAVVLGGMSEAEQAAEHFT